MTRGWGWGALVGALVVLGVAGADLPRLGQGVLGYENTDSYGAIYLHSAFADALAHGRSPLTDPDQLVPVGQPLFALHGGNVLEMVLSALFGIVAPLPLAYNLGAICWPALNLLAFVPLGRHLWGRLDAALAGGAAWALFPPYLAELAAGRLTQVALVGLPLAVLGLLRVAERPRPQDRWLAAGGLALTGVGYWFYGLFLGLLIPVFWLHGRAHRPTRLLVRDLLWVGVVAGLIALPFLLPALLPRLLGWAPDPPTGALNPVFDNALRLSGAQPRRLQGGLPWAWALGVGATLAWGRRQALWLGLAALCAFFALGPATRLGEGALWLPYALLWKVVPFLDRLTHPSRWLGVGGLFLAVAAADGLARRAPRALVALPLLGLGQLYVDHHLPLGTWALTTPPVWSAVAQRSGAVIVVPVLKAANTCRWRVGRPLLGGMTEAQPWAWPPEYRRFVEGSALLMALWDLGRMHDREVPVYQADLDRLRAAGFETVLLDQESWDALPSKEFLDPRARLTQTFGAADLDDASGAIWTLPVTGSPGAPPDLGLRLPEP